MRVRTAECGDAHLLGGQWVFHERIPVVSGFLLLALSASCDLSFFIYRQDKHFLQHFIQPPSTPAPQDSAHVQLCCPQDG